MADITMCAGVLKDGTPCPRREECYRHVARINEYWQAWFTDAFGLDCDEFWPVAGLCDEEAHK